MVATYELWYGSLGNRFGEFGSREEALDAVLNVEAELGLEYAGMLDLSIERQDGTGEILAEGDNLIAMARARRERGPEGGTSPASDTPAPRRGSAITDARRIGIDASAILGSLNAANNVSSILDSLSGASEIARAADAAFLRIATVPDLSLFTTDIASMYRSHAAITALSSLTSDIWEGLRVEQSAGLRQMADSINANLLTGITQAALEATEMNRTRLVEAAVQIAQQASAASRLGTYVLPMPDEPQVSFILERTEDMDILAAVASGKESEDGEPTVILWRVDSDTLVDLAG